MAKNELSCFFFILLIGAGLSTSACREISVRFLFAFFIREKTKLFFSA
jgi:hypothetical protein